VSERDAALPPEPPRREPSWTFLSNHAHVLVCLVEQPDLRLRDIAHLIGITERAALVIVKDLEHGGYLRRVREGRRNRYELDLDGRLRHPLEAAHTIGELLSALTSDAPLRSPIEPRRR
jgi:DNA-binding MarR family transcriptional regulator